MLFWRSEVHANLVMDGSFREGFAHWTVLGTGVSAYDYYGVGVEVWDAHLSQTLSTVPGQTYQVTCLAGLENYPPDYSVGGFGVYMGPMGGATSTVIAYSRGYPFEPRSFSGLYTATSSETTFAFSGYSPEGVWHVGGFRVEPVAVPEASTWCAGVFMGAVLVAGSAREIRRKRAVARRILGMPSPGD